MVLFSEMYLSELIGVRVVDRLQDPIGTIKDILFSVGEVFPKITGLLIKRQDKNEESVILINEIDMIGKQFVTTASIQGRIVFTKLRADELLLWRDVVDKQVVDTEGARVIRVNDLKLAKVDQDIRLAAADVGMRGLLRRLGALALFEKLLSFFGRGIAETLIGWDHVESLKTGRVKGEITVPSKHLTDLHPADIAHIISQVHTEEKTAIFQSLSEKAAAESLHELEPKIQAMLLLTIDTKKALAILERMPVDEAADVLGDLPEEKTEEFLRLMRPRKAAEIGKLLKHEEETAGGLMTTEFITIPEDHSIEQTINHLRALAPGAETIYYLYVVDKEERLVGVLSLRSLIVSFPEKSVHEIMNKEPIVVSPTMNQRKVAEVISKYNLLAVPVVDENRKLLGIVTVDDVIDFILPPLSRKKRQMVG
ncbi:MAG: CBS domain-containing protein [Candidatus Margulisbacteria bacterium]|nr:CBS domain-containing protein [Candidatus Margulisiibacteriota bacterium]